MVSVISFVKPWDRFKFLVYLCLSLSTYETKSDLFHNRTIKDAFVKTHLLSSAKHVTRTEMMTMLRNYVQCNHIFHPISARQFGYYLKAAMATLQDLFINDVLGDYTTRYH